MNFDPVYRDSCPCVANWPFCHQLRHAALGRRELGWRSDQSGSPGSVRRLLGRKPRRTTAEGGRRRTAPSASVRGGNWRGASRRHRSSVDELAERYGLEKIKTIGDCYMVAAGVPAPRPDHARALALMALDMLEAMRSDDEVGHLGHELRVGINSGPVVAGVIGGKRFL